MSFSRYTKHKDGIVMSDETTSNHFFLLNYRNNFLYGYQLISEGQILLQKFGYSELQDALNDTIFVRNHATNREVYRIEPVRSLQCVSLSLRSPTTQLIGFKSGFKSVREANQHIETIQSIVHLIDEECQFSSHEQATLAYA